MLAAIAASGATRPRYGGTLRIETHAALVTLDPAQPVGVGDVAVRDSLVRLISDTLTELDANARPVPSLSVRWQSSVGDRVWQFWIRPGVFLQNGASLTPAHVAGALTSANPNWKVRASSDVVTIETETPIVDLPAELSRAKYAIVLRTAEGLVGTGPFRVEQFIAGQRLLLGANDSCWQGRPYVDAVDVALNRPLRDEMTDLQLGRTDVVEIASEQARQAAQENRRVVMTPPTELIAIVFPAGTGAAEDPRLREAISRAIDRGAIQNVILQKQGERAGAMLPQWISGYALLFDSSADISRARQLRAQVPAAQSGVVLTYDPGDGVARSIAERVAVNVRDAGIVMQTIPATAQNSQSPRLIRVPIDTSNATVALASAVALIDASQTAQVLAARSSQELFDLERGLLQDYRVVPIVHVPHAVAIAPRVRNWVSGRDRLWPAQDLWLEGGAQ